jgi:hypothetical protein
MADKVSNPRTMMRTAASLAILMILAGAYVMNKRRAQHRTELDLMKDLEAQLEAPEPGLGVGGLPEVPESVELSAQVMRIGRELQGRMAPCLERWPEHPDEARIYVRSDPAGRLVELQVQDAPEAAQPCLLNALEKGRYPREIEGIAYLPLRFDGGFEPPE